MSSGWRGRRRSPTVVGRARQLRAQRRGQRATRWFGWLLIVTAVAFALDPDYPVPWMFAASSSTSRRVGLSELPATVFPRGAAFAPEARFCWTWPGPVRPVTLVLLDEDLDEVARLPGLDGTECRLPEALATLLRDGRQWHWFVEAVEGGRVWRSRLTAFTFPS